MKDDKLHGDRMAVRLTEYFYRTHPENITVCKEALKTIVSFSSLIFSVLIFVNVWKPAANNWPILAATAFYVLIIGMSAYLYRPINIIYPIAMEWDALFQYFCDEEEKTVIHRSISAYLGAIGDNKPVIRRFEKWTFAVQIIFFLFVVSVAASFLIRVV